jgi:hypothetical protein
MSKGKTRLFRLRGALLSEIKDKNFPLHYDEQFQFEPKSGPPKVQYYDDESRINEIRLHAFFRHVEHVLQPYLKGEDLPIVLLAVNYYVGDFKKVTHLGKRITMSIHGNFDRHSVAEIKSRLKQEMGTGQKTPKS